MNPILFKAILAMDAYNRGYNAGISNLSDADNIKIGTAEIYDTKGDVGAQNIGFYAIAYKMQSGEKIISYRGTDDFDGVEDLATSKDVSAWLLGGGTTGLRREPWRFSFTIR